MHGEDCRAWVSLARHDRHRHPSCFNMIMTRVDTTNYHCSYVSSVIIKDKVKFLIIIIIIIIIVIATIIIITMITLITMITTITVIILIIIVIIMVNL